VRPRLSARRLHPRSEGSAVKPEVPVLAASVIICTRNRHDLLAGSVHSILDADHVPAEIIIVDQSDGPLVALDVPSGPCRVRHVQATPDGSSSARNRGAAEAGEDTLVFTDDDMIADARWLQSLVNTLFHARPNDVVTGRVLAGCVEIAGAFVPATVDATRPGVYIGRLSRDVLAGGNMAIRRTAFLSSGGFDTRLGPGSRFPAAEDNDFGFRVLEQGGRILYEPAAVLYHRAWRAPAAFLPLRFAYGRGKGGFYAKHLHIRDTHMLRRLIVDLARRPVRAARFALHPRRGLGELAYGMGMLRGLVEWSLGSFAPRRTVPAPVRLAR